MIEIYNHNNFNFNSNGNMTLIPTSCIGFMQLNGECNLKIEHPFDKEGRWTYILEDNIIAISTPWSDKQLFRIYNTVKTITGITAYARHIYFDLIDYVLLDIRPTNKTGQQALDIILANTPFTGHSDITTTNTSYFIRQNILNALNGSEDNSFINLWGGEIFLDNFNLYINSHIGANHGVKVQFGYNLKEIEENINFDSVATRIIPVGANEIMLSGSSPWIDSQYINSYANVKTKVIKYDDVKVKTNPEDEEGFATLEEAQQELINRCNQEYANGIDIPQVNYKVNMALLRNTTAYKGFEILEDVNIGDTIQCTHNNLNIDISARCISLEWEIDIESNNPKITTIELGNFQDNYFNNQSDIQNLSSNVINTNGSVNGDSIEGIINASKTKFNAYKDATQINQIRALLFEDRDPASSTFGAISIGTMGIEISNQLVGGEWVWNTFGTGQGFNANYINLGTLTKIIIQSLSNNCYLNLDNGQFRLGATNGTDIATYTNNSSTWRHSNLENTIIDSTGLKKNNRPYHNLITFGYCTTGGANPATETIQLGDEWKNTNFKVIASVVDTLNSRSDEYIKRIQLDVNNVDLVNATFQITGSWTSIYSGAEYNKELKSMYFVIGG